MHHHHRRLIFIYSFVFFSSVEPCPIPITLRGPSTGSFTMMNPSLGTAVESWTEIMKTLQKAKPEWWKNVHVDMSEYSDVQVPVESAASAVDEPIVDLQAMVTDHCSSSTCPEDETIYGTADSRPASDDDDDDDLKSTRR